MAEMLIVGVTGSTHDRHERLIRKLASESILSDHCLESFKAELLQASPFKQLLRIFYDARHQTVYVSLSTRLPDPDPKETGAAGLRNLLLNQDINRHLGLLLLMLSSSVVIMVHDNAELGISWLSHLRSCQKSWRLLLSSSAAGGVDSVKAAVGLDPSVKTEDSDSEVDKLIRGLSQRPVALLLFAIQTNRMSTKSSEQLNSMVRGLIQRSPILLGKNVTHPPRSQSKPAKPINMKEDRDNTSLFELHVSVTAVAVPPLQINPVANLRALIDLIPASTKADSKGTCLLDDAECFGALQSEEEIVAAEGLQRLKEIIEDRRDGLQFTSTAIHGAGEVGGSGPPNPLTSTEAVATVWSRLWPVLEKAWRVAEDEDLQRPFLMGSGREGNSHMSKVYQGGISIPPEAAQTRGQAAMVGRMGEDDGNEHSRSGVDGSDKELGEGGNNKVFGDPREGSKSNLLGMVLPACRYLARGTNIVFKYSLAKSERAVEAASKAYLMELPPIYPSRVHRSALHRSLQLLSSWARGPACESAAQKLAESCKIQWRNRRQCEALSLTGRPCILRAGHEEQHQSSITILKAVASGSIQEVIPDVFSILKANHLESQLIPPVVSVQQRLDDSKDVRRVSGSGGGNPLAAETSSALPQPLGPTQHHAVIALSLLDGSQCELGPWIGLTVVGPASLSADRRGVMHQPGLASGRLQQFPLPLTPEYLEERARRSAQQQQQPHKVKRQQHSGGSQSQGGKATKGFPTLAESVKKQQRSAPASKANQTVETDQEVTPNDLLLHSEVLSASEESTALRQSLLRTWPGALDHVPIGCLVSFPEGSAAPGKPMSVIGDSTSHHTAQASSSESARALRSALDSSRRQTAAAAAKSPAVKRESDLAVYFAVEYETLDGRRFFPTHQQLGYKELQGSGNKSNVQGKTASSGSFSRFLLNTDLPLFLEAPQHKTGDTPAGQQSALPNNSDGTGMCHPINMAVLRRIWVQTPPSSDGPLLACRPVVDFKQVAPVQLPAEAIEVLLSDQRAEGEAWDVSKQTSEDTARLAQGPVHTSKADSERSDGAYPPKKTVGGWRLGQIQIMPSNEVRLPPDSLCIVTLPSVYAAPLSWLVPNSVVDKSSKTSKEALCPIIPVREAWPFTAKLAKGSILFPCKP